MKFTNLMRSILIAWFGLLVTPTLLAAADLENNKEQTAYSVQSLGTLGGTQSAAYGVNNRGWVRSPLAERRGHRLGQLGRGHE
jgi:hypothetical protein